MKAPTCPRHKQALRTTSHGKICQACVDEARQLREAREASERENDLGESPTEMRTLYAYG